ncbi:unnamed protein product [Xylocopa violacea]|uniref:Uncharacterized protein n=1 Tax=Xylocopa violacea TaxID=135666 RepID=A0ABP1NL82_XYLVO
MTGRSSTKRTGLCLLALLLSCLSSDKCSVVGEPEPIPSELIYSKDIIKNAENLLLLKKLGQVIQEQQDMEERKKELEDVEMVIQTVLRAREKPESEQLPTPNAVVSPTQRSGKRTAISYMSALCHFKICNMGRKRQLHK